MTTDPAPAEAATRRAAIFAGIARSWKELQETVSGLDDRQLAAPGPDGWSIRDHLAHLGHWEQYLLAEMEGRDPMAALGLDAHQDRTEEVLNAALQRLDAGRPPAEARRLLADVHAVLLARLEALSDADLVRWLAGVEENVTGHLDLHRPWIRDLARSVASGTPE